MNKILVAPVIATLIIAIFNILLGDIFQGGLWFLATIVLSLIFLPIVVEMNDKDVPILQIFSMMIIIAIFLSIFAFFDFKRAGIPIERSLLYGIGVGLLTVVTIMFIRSKD